MEEEEVLLEEHKELIQLFMHEDSLAWNMTYFYIVLNTGLFSALGALLSRLGFLEVAAIYVVPSVIGGLIGIAWRFSFKRSELHRQSRMFQAMMIEDQLTRRNLPLDTLRSCESRLYQGNVLKDPDGNLRWPNTRPLRRFEKIESLKIIHGGTIAFAVIWFAFAVIGLAHLGGVLN